MFFILFIILVGYAQPAAVDSLFVVGEPLSTICSSCEIPTMVYTIKRTSTLTALVVSMGPSGEPPTVQLPPNCSVA